MRDGTDTDATFDLEGRRRTRLPVPSLPRSRAWRRLARLVVAGVLVASGCEASPKITDPLASLTTVDAGARVHLAAMDALEAQGRDDEAYLDALHRAVWRPGYTVKVREAAVRRLIIIDLPGLKKTLRRHLPNMVAWQGLTRLCEIIAEEGWEDLTPALVSSWARPVSGKPDDKRPEYLALVRLHGADRVPDVVFELFVSSNRPSQQGLRSRCWELMERLGARERLVELLQSEPASDDDDLFLQDLSAGARDLGIVPVNREEIIWMRKLRQPQRQAFWEEARLAMQQLPPGRAQTMELRSLAVVVAAARHDPELLTASETDLYARLDAKLRGRKRYAHGSDYEGSGASRRNHLYDWRNELTWGDLAAMLLLLRAMEVQAVVDHLFDYAERDRLDESTEYGGVIQLDEKGRFEVLEFPPRVRHHDQKFLASQAMLDAGYTSLFHFHFHVQQIRNEDYAGPGFGDVNYADNTRANCLVFTSVRRGAMNVDFYRHGRVLVDLGVIETGGGRSARAGDAGSGRDGGSGGGAADRSANGA